MDPTIAFWIGGLGWHDANASLLAALHEPVSAEDTVFAGVFCVDPFRRDADIFAALRAAGITGVVNLPSVSFFDGDFGAILGSFNLGIDREIEFLRSARLAGFRIAGCVSAAGPVDQMVQAGAEFIVAHDGVPQPGREDPSEAIAEWLRQRFGTSGPTVISAGRLLSTLADNEPT